MFFTSTYYSAASHFLVVLSPMLCFLFSVFLFLSLAFLFHVSLSPAYLFHVPFSLAYLFHVSLSPSYLFHVSLCPAFLFHVSFSPAYLFHVSLSPSYLFHVSLSPAFLFHVSLSPAFLYLMFLFYLPQLFALINYFISCLLPSLTIICHLPFKFFLLLIRFSLFVPHVLISLQQQFPPASSFLCSFSWPCYSGLQHYKKNWLYNY